MTEMTADIPARRNYGFAIGLLTGTCVGAGLMLWLAPATAKELRRRMIASAKDLSNRTSARYEEASSSIGAAVGELARRGQDVGDDVAASVARGAHEVARTAQAVERIATSATSNRR